MNRVNPAVLLAALALAPSVQAADFEGVVEMTSSIGIGEMRVVYQVSKVGLRSEVVVAPPFPSTAAVVKKPNPDLIYVISDSGKTYKEIDAKKLWAKMPPIPESMKRTYTVKKLGRETVQGYPCEHVRVTNNKGDATAEMWLTNELLDEELVSRLEQLAPSSGSNDQAYQKALKDAGVSGFSMRTIARAMGMEVTTEVVKVEKKPIPPSVFEIPAGYKKVDPDKGLLPAPSDEDLKKMMKKLLEKREGGGTNAPAQQEDTSGVQHL